MSSQPLPICLIATAGIVFLVSGCASTQDPAKLAYAGVPFHDQVYNSGPQKIPGHVQCAFYDLGGEGVAYHDVDASNNGSGTLNPADGNYLNEFRLNEGVDISYTKFFDEPIDNSPYNLVPPPDKQLYVGWTAPGEWFNLSVNVERAGIYTVDLLYTSKLGGSISLDRNGQPLIKPVEILSTQTDKDPLDWRQWHHWNILTNLAQVRLPKGQSVLTVHIVAQGNMNLAWFNFKPKN